MLRKKILVFVVMVFVSLSCSSPFTTKSFSAPMFSASSSTPTLAPTATFTPSPTPAPTPPPTVLIELAEQALITGDYETARREFLSAQNSNDPEIRAAAALGVGRALFLLENYSTAIDNLVQMIDAYPDSIYRANAYYFLARSYEATNIWGKAADAYAKFLTLKPDVLDAFIQEKRGDALLAAGNPAEAAEAFSAAILAPQEGTTIWIELKLAQAYAAVGDFSTAIKKYIEIYENSNNDYARAQANLLMGQTYLTMGMPEQAYARFQDSVDKFPKSYDSYSGLVELISNDIPVNEFNRGMVDYYAGQYGLAIEAFDRHIKDDGNQTGRAYYFRALSHLSLNDPEKAIRDFDIVISSYPSDNLWASAWEEKAFTLWAYLEKYDEAAALLIQYVDQFPDSSPAPEYLFQAARILERGERLADSAAVWERLMNQYPSAEKSYRGLFLAGISYYRANDFAKALTVFQRALLLSDVPAEQAASYLWIGKAQQAMEDAGAARQAWEQAAQRDPTGYYSERANELLQNKPPFSIDQPVDLGYNLEQERAQAEEWLRATFAIPAETDLNSLGEMADDPRAIRGNTFWELGLYKEARNEFESLRQTVSSDPVQTYRLMNHLLKLGIYRSAILSSRQILDLAGLDDVGTLKAPVYFNHIRFGVYFKDLVLQTSQTEQIHPLFLLSVLRQESMFEEYALSGAGARGLMQIMPATGHEIFSTLGWPEDYDETDLYRPNVNIVFGASYLARQRDLFDGNLFAALAAYNGGPGNTIIWNKLALGDPDLLLEVIRADETRTYITHIYENFNIYRLLYQRGY